MKTKLLLILLSLIVSSVCFGGDSYRLIVTDWKGYSETRIYITSYDDPNAFRFSNLYRFKQSKDETETMKQLMLYLREEKLLSYWTHKMQELKFKKFDHYTEELILNSFLFSGYKVTAMMTENRGELKDFRTERTYFFSKD